MKTLCFNTRIRLLLWAVLFALSFVKTNAQSLDEAKEMYRDGLYEEAVEVLVQAADKDTKNTSLNHMAGVALQQTGRPQEAKKYLARGTNDSNINLAEIAFEEYRFDDADQFIDKYEKALKKAKKNAEVPEAVIALREQIEKGRTMLDRVEQIVIIDSIAVDKDEFFRAYKLAASSGSLKGREALPPGASLADPGVVFVTENQRTKIWSMPDDNENYVLVEADLLDDGKWSEPQLLGEDLGEGGDANFPFMLSDGETLYFANDGENSLGGYDIFISRRDDDSFFQPQNIGMPYNSPFDDYMLVIDEETGSGWWATDRNQLGDKITIYRFIPSELRKNYSPDTEGLADLALARNYKATQQPGVDYSDMIAKMDALTVKTEQRQREFTLALPDGRVYTSLRDFKNTTARSMMTEYIGLERQLQQVEKQLAGLRSDYRKGQTDRAREILAMEKDVDAMRARLKSLKNDIVKSEK